MHLPQDCYNDFCRFLICSLHGIYHSCIEITIKQEPKYDGKTVEKPYEIRQESNKVSEPSYDGNRICFLWTSVGVRLQLGCILELSSYLGKAKVIMFEKHIAQNFGIRKLIIESHLESNMIQSLLSRLYGILKKTTGCDKHIPTSLSTIHYLVVPCIPLLDNYGISPLMATLLLLLWWFSLF
ncbi:unnamed protein product [Lactuca saligna]|uniref:Uncharacterized protein n=1 Tax=Lactuca saligna TaxID=75948 RepID=A0AA36EHM7_LACSI|nr:unnamed protein product [Lactuca saligna]